MCSVMSDALQPARLLCPWDFSRQEYRSGLPFPPPEDIPDPGIKLKPPTSAVSPALQVDCLPTESLGKTLLLIKDELFSKWFCIDNSICKGNYFVNIPYY